MSLMTDDKYEATTDGGRLQVNVVGARPEHTPYLWIGVDDSHLDTISEEEMVDLADAIYEAVGRFPSGE